MTSGGSLDVLLYATLQVSPSSKTGGHGDEVEEALERGIDEHRLSICRDSDPLMSSVEERASDVRYVEARVRWSDRSQLRSVTTWQVFIGCSLRKQWSDQSRWNEIEP